MVPLAALRQQHNKLQRAASLIVAFSMFSASAGNLLNSSFQRNVQGTAYLGPALFWAIVRSPLDCLRLCASLPSCQAANLCDLPLAARGQVKKLNCTLLSDGGVGKVANWSASCFSSEKTSRPAAFVPVTCQNGGTAIQNGTACSCPAQYSGTYCERYIRGEGVASPGTPPWGGGVVTGAVPGERARYFGGRMRPDPVRHSYPSTIGCCIAGDCTEPYKRGFGTSYNGVYLIQPIAAPAPFHVQCIMDWGGATYPFKRSDMSSSLNWTMLKTGYGTGKLAADPLFAEYFIGLDNLHYLTAQAPWNLHVSLVDAVTYNWSSAYYQPAFVDTEATRYRLDHPNFFAGGNVLPDDGFAGKDPLLLSTTDKDPELCAAKHHGAGWYGPDCSTGHSVFSTQPTWPVKGQVLPLASVEFAMVRVGDYY